MGRVCSMESKATLPILVRRAGTRVAKTKFRRSWKGKDSWHVREKSAWFAYLLREPPESPPSPVIRPPKKQQQEHCSININIEKVQGTFTYPGL